MSFQTVSLINPIYNSALFDQGVPSSRALNAVPMSLQNFYTSADICSSDMSATKELGAPTSLANCLMARRTSDFLYIGTTHINPLSVTKSWQQVSPLDDCPPFLVAKNLSMKKKSLILLYLNILSFVLFSG